MESVDGFNAENESVEEYIKCFLEKQHSSILTNDDDTFVVEVFCGCVHFNKFLCIAVDSFYETEGKTFLHKEKNLYKVICYLLAFRLHELGSTHFKKFILTQHLNKMFTFLNYFLSECNQGTLLYNRWCSAYDVSFVDEKIVCPIQNRKEDLTLLINEVSHIVKNENTMIPQSKPLTKTKEFNLTKPKPRSVPLPDKVPTLAKVKSVPKHVFEAPKELERIENLKLENHQRIVQEHQISNQNQFRCANTEKSTKARDKINEILLEENEKLDFNRRHTRSLPKFTPHNKPIKMNAAAILREGALFEKREKEEAEILNKLLLGAKDKSEFLDWQKSMQQKDKNQSLMESEYRKLQGKISREQAIIGQQEQTEQKQMLVAEFKADKAKMMEEFIQSKAEDHKKMRTLVEDIIEGHQNVHEAREQLQQHKRKIVQQVNAESREMMRQALEDAEEEMQRRTKLIQKIRAMESVPFIRNTFVDMTTTAGHALLSEMSFAELKERLELLKEKEQALKEEKRTQIIHDKEAKTDMLMNTMARITTHRNELSIAATNEENEIIKAKKQQRQLIETDDKLKALQDELLRKKEERLHRAEKMKIKPNKKQAAQTKTLIRERNNLEKSRWKQLEMTQQRMAQLQSR